jgi:DGQHR domain-containing protein
MKGHCLGHEVYRGFASLRDLARISRADIFDQHKNPTGTQRNLSRQHARKAYQYVSSVQNAFYPEIILNIRDASYVNFKPARTEDGVNFGTLGFTKDPNQVASIVVSRLDGNHRLWFVDGHEKGMDAVERPCSFCVLMLQNLEEELELFSAINDNQMGMNTSHLHNITARLLGAKALKVKDPALYIVQQLQKESGSPFYRRIHEGGRVKRGATLSGLTIANLKNAINDMLTRSAKLSQFPDADAQFTIISNYWNAVRKWLPDAWKRPTDYTIFRGVGLLAVTYLGVEIIDRCLLKGKFETDDMFVYLKQIPGTEVFLAKEGIAYAGRAGGRKMASDLIADLEEEGEVSLSKLQKMILGGK